MRTRTLLTALAAFGVLGAACARLTGPGAGGVDHPSGGEELVLGVAIGGGLLPPEYALRAYPIFSLYGDGRLIIEGPQIAIYPGPAMPTLLQRTVTEEGVQAILEAAREAGLLGPDRTYDYPCVMDAGTTTFTVNADGRTHVISAYALFEGEGGCDDVDRAARTKLLEFQTKLGDLGSWLPEGSLGGEEAYVERELRVYVRPDRQAPDDLRQRVVEWPLATPLAAFGEPIAEWPETRCGTVSGADLDLLRAEVRSANELTPWRSDGDRHLLTFRPLLPDERGC